jgi:hypothetical protein
MQGNGRVAAGLQIVKGKIFTSFETLHQFHINLG